MAKALYRKYRPCKLADVVGQEQVTGVLSKSLAQNKVSHAYLFVGPRGTGKTSVARIFAHEINGFKYEIEDDYIDIIEIDGASNRGIDDIRELREKATIAPTSGKYKIYIIDEVHMLTKEAFNALLKTLEEPPRHVIFIMATTEINKVPVTITSRSQLFTFKLAEPAVMLEFLHGIVKKEQIKITDDALAIVAKRGGGSFRDTLSLLDQISTLSDQEITKELVISALGLPEDEKIGELIKVYLDGDVGRIADVLQNLLASGVRAEIIAEEAINYIMENPKPELLALLDKLPDVRAPFPEAKLLVALSSNLSAATSARVPTKKISNKNSDFSKEKFLREIKNASDTVYLQLVKSTFETLDNVLNIYPATKVSETILKAKNNKAILDKYAGGIVINVHSHDDKPKSVKNDPVLNNISDIMGGEVINDGGENPF